MKASTKRAVVYLTVLVIGYALGFYDGAPPYGPISIGPSLLFLFFAFVVVAKLGALFLSRARWGRSGSGGAGNAPSPRVPRSPIARPPVLRARETLGQA